MDNLLASLDSALGLLLLAALAFGDTLIGVGFFIFGEVAFLAAGAAITTNALYLPAIVVLVAAWAGDVTSYAIGRKYGARMSTRYLKRLKRRQAWRRAQSELRKRGEVFVVVSRFLGPVAWVTPFLAGTLGMPPRRFVPAAALGVLLGVGQFLVYGAIGGHLIGSFLPFVMDHLAVIALVASMLISSIYVWRRSERATWVKALKAVTMASAVFLTSNLIYFFVLNSHTVPDAPRTTFDTVCHAADGPFVVGAGQTSLHLPQPVNVILISDAPGSALMDDLGWHRNKTFTHNDISFTNYLSLLLQSTPPVSELYLDGIPADSAHQLPGTIKVREHIRWWDMGAGVHFGAISKTDEIAIKYYSHLPVLLHDIDPQVDASRALLAEQLASMPDYQVLGHASLAPPVSDDVVADYETDGDILVLAESSATMPANLLDCLQIAPLQERA
ncbi:MAG: LssY C-terminal domain-containing protein [Rhodobacteraceae bacterium]|nr:LssY C-terminal domain-containing protein [Paracoccaceae bacterium]